MNKEIIISKQDLEDAGKKNYEAFLDLFVNQYKKAIGDTLTPDTMELLNSDQHALLAFSTFYEQMNDGGFILLIQNGYGPYIFINPFAKSMRLMGAMDLSKLIYKAKKIYDQKKTDLERDYTEDEYMALYEQFDNLGELDDEFQNHKEDYIKALAKYVDAHIESFAKVI
jgi:hypothetical protein